MNQDNWYDQQVQQHFSTTDKPKRTKKTVPLYTLIICMLVTALVGGGVGGVIVNAMQPEAAVQDQANLAANANANENNAASGDQATAGAQENTSLPTFVNSSTGQYTKAQIIEMNTPSIVGIDVEVQTASGWMGQTAVESGSGSGVIISSDGYIVTNDHVVADALSIKVYLHDDTEYEATLVSTDAKSDLAVIKIEATGLKAVTMGDSDALQMGDDVIAIGNPLGELRGSATSGMISATARTITIEGQEMTLIQTDAAINPGNSGGGLFNAKGELIGITNAKIASSQVEGLGFAIPVNEVKTVTQDLIDYGYVSGRAYLGVYTQNVAASADSNVDGRGDNSQNFGLGDLFGFGGDSGGSYSQPTATYVQVVQVVAGSAANTAGILAGDLILQVDDKEITTQSELSNAIGEYSAGDVATIKVQRDNETLELTVTFGELVPDEG